MILEGGENGHELSLSPSLLGGNYTAAMPVTPRDDDSTLDTRRPRVQDEGVTDIDMPEDAAALPEEAAEKPEDAAAWHSK